jgi:hypothetical protein
MLKYLRTAVTAFSLTACVLLIALWVRSYLRSDDLFMRLSPNHTAAVNSQEGSLLLILWTERPPNRQWGWRSTSLQPRQYTWRRYQGKVLSKLGIRYEHVDARLYRAASAPHWFVILPFASLTAALWLPWSKRSSLRTLLIATTLVAVGLGVVIYLAR